MQCHPQQISVLQNQVLKNILEVEQHIASLEVYKMTRRFPLKTYTLVFMYKYVYQLIPSTLLGMFIYTNDIVFLSIVQNFGMISPKRSEMLKAYISSK